MCFIFSVHWSIIPDNFRSEALLLLVRDLAFDVGSVNCRIAALVGLAYLFDHCSRSRQTLKFLLPSLAMLINDGKDSVRNTYLDLLISVHSVFPDLQLPPTETLVACLESSSPSVSKRVGALLLDTYFPLSQSLLVKQQKCHDLKCLGATAALKFYSHLPGYLTKTSSSRETLSNFICLLLSDDVPDVLTLEIVAALLGAIKPHLKSKSCSGLSKVLGTAAIESMIDRYSGRLPEMSAIFNIMSVYPSTDTSLNKKLLNSVSPLLEASESISGVFEVLLHSKQLDGYVTNVMEEFIELLSKKAACSERPRKRAKLSNTSISAILKQIQSISLHPLALANLVEHRKFNDLRCLLFKCTERIKSTPEEILTSGNQYLVDSAELLLRLSPLALEYRLCKDGSDQESSFRERKEVARFVLDLANVLLPHSSARSTIGIATLETCLRLAPDMAMVGFLDSSLLLSYIRTFAFDRRFKGLEAHVQQAKLLDQATQLMEIYSREPALENHSDYVQELISAVSQGIEYLFEVVPKLSTQGRKVIPKWFGLNGPASTEHQASCPNNGPAHI
ncbi:Condensin-2 complex subunit G2 [Entomophthora muscae]|uniref:Condensin-2 complex subunit G2 n=1 Tax=Entomophthora muscae TaxID=34485 RepID=A0ACC2SJD5_9FUNG|nr:Condensin-2 complex subunit G2 [Entomophthora muscae]